jgi:hypothetical protein
MVMDFAFGPNQGQGVPAIEGSDGLMLDLASLNISIPAGGSFHGVLPGRGTGPIVSVTTGEVTSVQSYNISTGDFVELHTLPFNFTGCNRPSLVVRDLILGIPIHRSLL